MRTCTRLGPRPPPRPAPSVGQPHPPCCLGDALPQWHPRAPLPGWQPAEEKHACGSAVRVGKSNAPTHTHPRTRRNDACARNGLCLGPPSMAASTPGQLDRPVLGTHDVPPPTAHVSRNLTDRSRHATRTRYGGEWGKVLAPPHREGHGVGRCIILQQRFNHQDRVTHKPLPCSSLRAEATRQRSAGAQR